MVDLALLPILAVAVLRATSEAIPITVLGRASVSPAHVLANAPRRRPTVLVERALGQTDAAVPRSVLQANARRRRIIRAIAIVHPLGVSDRRTRRHHTHRSRIIVLRRKRSLRALREVRPIQDMTIRVTRTSLPRRPVIRLQRRQRVSGRGSVNGPLTVERSVEASAISPAARIVVGDIDSASARDKHSERKTKTLHAQMMHACRHSC